MTGERTFHVAERPSTWQPRDSAVAAAFIVAGFIFSALLPSWLWSVAGVVGFGAYLAWAARRNRRQPGMPPRWSPGQSAGPNS